MRVWQKHILYEEEKKNEERERARESRREREQLNKISIQDGHDNIRGSWNWSPEQIESSTQLLNRIFYAFD